MSKDALVLEWSGITADDILASVEHELTKKMFADVLPIRGSWHCQNTTHGHTNQSSTPR